MRAIWAMGVALALGAGSDPYVRSRVDNGVLPDSEAHCLWWGVQTVTFHQNQDGNPDVPGDNEFLATSRAIQSWNEAAEGCSHLRLLEGPRVAERDIGWDPDSSNNENLIVYRMTWCGDPNVVPTDDPCWDDLTCQNKYNCFDQARTTIAITTTTYDKKTGQIFDADIEGNGAFFLYTTVDSPPCERPDFHPNCVATDVQNTMTHELGHALGLDHTTRPGSTMNPSAPSGETAKRIIDPDTRSFLCDVYPVGSPARDCVISVMGQELGEAATGCAATGALPGAMAVFALARLFWRRRSRAG